MKYVNCFLHLKRSSVIIAFRCIMSISDIFLFTPTVSEINMESQMKTMFVWILKLNKLCWRNKENNKKISGVYIHTECFKVEINIFNYWTKTLHCHFHLSVLLQSYCISPFLTELLVSSREKLLNPLLLSQQESQTF